MFNEEELILIKSCLLTTKATYKMLLFKKESKEILKNKIKEIDNLIEKIR